MVLALACAMALTTAAGAQAQTLRGTVIGQPAVHGASAVVPVLLSSASARSLHARNVLSKVVVPVKGGLRASTGALAPAQLRLGDRVRATVARGARASRPLVGVLRVVTRGPGASFATLAARRTSAQDNATKALESVTKLAESITAVVGPVVPTGGDPDDLARLRTELLGLRSNLNRLISDLRETRTGLSDTIAGIERDRPSDAARRDAVARQQEPLLAGLANVRDDAEASANLLEGAVAQLDETINEVGGESAVAIPIETTSTVTNVLYAVLDLLRNLSVP
jgi:hypothetical protein